MGAPEHMALTLGKAGHVDHGKTRLVQALTGVNTDRLAEERRRGLSIELGFAELELGGGQSLSVVDVPGHERFIRTMVAGATGVDMFLLVVAADEGVMPQTREHLAVLEALQVEHGLIALSKSDRADDDARALAGEEARTLLRDARLVEVSAATGAGLDELRAGLAELADRVDAERPGRDVDEGSAVLHVDRAFTMRGIGTVVTGTLWSGSVTTGERVEILPGGGGARIRSLQVHNRNADRGLPGQRVALNLSGVKPEEVARGSVVVTAGAAVRPSYRIDVELRLAREGSVDGERVQVHHGTRAVPARVVELGDGLAQLRLESPLVAGPGDRFVLRSIARVNTIGGGTVLDPAPRRHGPRSDAHDRLEAIRARGLESVLAEERRHRSEASAAGRVRRERASEELRGRPLNDRERLLLALVRAGGTEPETASALADR